MKKRLPCRLSGPSSITLQSNNLCICTLLCLFPQFYNIFWGCILDQFSTIYVSIAYLCIAYRKEKKSVLTCSTFVCAKVTFRLQIHRHAAVAQFLFVQRSPVHMPNTLSCLFCHCDKREALLNQSRANQILVIHLPYCCDLSVLEQLLNFILLKRFLEQLHCIVCDGPRLLISIRIISQFKTCTTYLLHKVQLTVINTVITTPAKTVTTATRLPASIQAVRISDQHS